MNRRTFIGLAGASTAAVATAGCLSGSLGSTGSGPEDMTVDDVENLNVETTDRNTIEVQGVGTVGRLDVEVLHVVDRHLLRL